MVYLLNKESKFEVKVVIEGDLKRRETHYFEADAVTAAKFLSVEFNCPFVRKFE